MKLNADMISKLVTLLVMALLISACNSKTRIDEYRQNPASIMNAEDTVVILGRRHSSGHETEIDFVSCVGDSLASGQSAIPVIPEEQFVDALYPYFETSTAPMDVKNLDRLVQNPAIAEKFADFNLRYFIWIDGSTETTDKKGSISCAIGPGGGGCFGFATWDDEANYEANIWDFKNLQLTGKINAETQGTSYLPAIVIPIPMLARVQASACKSMAEQLKSFLQ
ncbi:MAG: hypothetical protein ACI9SC_000087 [Gammaproteobacteria bacterium]|jgi:hypothetical protein